MRHFGILLLACPLAIMAQPAENDPRVLQTLITEVQQLRLAIERSTLLGARTQLAISQLQLQEERATRLTQKLNDVREGLARSAADKNKTTATLRELESRQGQPEAAAAETQSQIKHFKLELEYMTALEQQQAAREGELSAEAQAAQKDVQDSRNWIAEMQRSLDAAIQQMLKPR